ncbi:endonuclease-reverse transcriptase [Elysia marginata]|uniref:Endonuclease-reverse transcriptase n=1 Tax=Elysia marginata TaxID=1093978 RepID=A0AAV4HIN0_9GAST|nr:endonuclease-reverse transcriptase [Elysia marginata]
MAETLERLQQMLNSTAKSSKTYRMEMNAKKTKTVHIGKDIKKVSILINGTPLKQVTKYQYLGHILSEGRNRHKIRKGKGKVLKTLRAALKEYNHRAKTEDTAMLCVLGFLLWVQNMDLHEGSQR